MRKELKLFYKVISFETLFWVLLIVGSVYYFQNIGNYESILLLWNSHIGMKNPDFKNITIYRLNRKTFIIINHFSNLTQKEFRRFH